jgi:hypothetical protein
LALFVITGLLPGSFLGGTMGLSIAGALLGSPVSSGLLPRVIVGVSMLLGIMVTGVAFVACGTIAGWVMGNLLGAVPVRAYFTGSGQSKKTKGNGPGDGISG